MLLSTLVIGLVTSVFLVQNEFYSDVIKRSALHENVRSATARVSAELRGVSAGGIVEAEADSVVYRLPMVVGGVCAVNGTETYLHLPLDGDSVDASEVSGYSVRDDAGAWTHNTATWASVYHSSGATPAAACEAPGAVTVGALDDFHRLDGLIATPALEVGDLVMIFRQLELKVAVSALDAASTAVFWGPAGGTITEFANSLSPNSAFEYRLANKTSFQDRVTGGNLSKIVAIRFSALGAAPASRANRDSLSFDLTATVPLGNAY
jgi:hypothetical protein